MSRQVSATDTHSLSLVLTVQSESSVVLLASTDRTACRWHADSEIIGHTVHMVDQTVGLTPVTSINRSRPSQQCI